MTRDFPTLPGAPRHARMALVFACAMLCVPVASFAAQGSGLVVTPLGDDLALGGGDAAPTAPVPERLPGEPVPFFTQDGGVGTSASEGPPLTALPEEPPSYKDGVIMAYLVELMRKQDKPCPSGARPPAPPSLLFSEPLCRVADSVGKGAEFAAASGQQGLYAARWRMFSASDQPAQQVAMLLRTQHCEALLEPYTHIGAWKGSSGWRIVLATLTDKPATSPGAAPQAAPEPASQADATVPVSPVPAAAAPQTAAARTEAFPAAPTAVPTANQGAPESLQASSPPRPDLPPLVGMAPASAAAPSAVTATIPGESTPVAPDAAPAAPASGSGQEARALFQLINDLRTKGGSCLGAPSRTAPPLGFDAGLQSAAEKEAAYAAARGGFGTALGAPPDMAAEAVTGYHAAKLSKLTSASRTPASAVLDVWMVNPTRCGMLLSTEYQDAGVAYKDGYWVVLMGRKAR